jgi:hypothetical protein
VRSCCSEGTPPILRCLCIAHTPHPHRSSRQRRRGHCCCRDFARTPTLYSEPPSPHPSPAIDVLVGPPARVSHGLCSSAAAAPSLGNVTVSDLRLVCSQRPAMQSPHQHAGVRRHDGCALLLDVMPSAKSQLRSALFCFSAPRLLVLPCLVDEPVMPSTTSPLHPAPAHSTLLCFSAPRLLVSPRLIDEPAMPSATSRSALLPSSASTRLASSRRRAGDAERRTPLCSVSRHPVCSSYLASSTSR